MDRVDVGFVIRFHYRKGDERFKWRYEFFKTRVLPRILSQTYNQFDIYIWCNLEHDNLFKKFGCKIIHAPDVRRYNPRGFFHDFVKYEETEGMPKLQVQIGIDSDDYIDRDFVKIIIDSVELHKTNHKNKSLHICFQPQLYILRGKQIRTMRTYTAHNGSAFMALYQPEEQPFRFIYEESHMSIIRKADIKKIIPKGYCYAVSHNINETTGKTLYDRLRNNKSILV